jgi:hypothetical protein
MHKKLIILLFAILLKLSANNQTVKLQPSFTAITVTNIDSSMNWYINTLNLRLRNRIDNDEKGFKQAILINSESMIELVELKMGISIDTLLSKYPKATQSLGFYKFGFTVSNIDKLYKELASKNVTFYGKLVTDPIDNKRTFLITDPDGNLLQFFEK